MNSCLDPARLLAFAIAEPDDYSESRDHLRRCLMCSDAYHLIARDHELIVRSLEVTARSVMGAPQRKPTPIRQMPARRKRPALITSLAAGGAGAMAAALMLILAGLHPGATTPGWQSTAATGAKSGMSSRPTIHAQSSVLAATSYAAPWQSSGMIFTDSTDDIGYHEAMAGTSNYQDLFYCNPQEDEGFCSASSVQG
jgi:hypothetical protein